jgi:hypothetical protein
MGFNLLRDWDGENYMVADRTGATAPIEFKAGDGSPHDIWAYTLKKLDEHGKRCRLRP